MSTSSQNPTPMLIAGDTKIEHIHYEIASPFPVQRKGHTYDVHQHKHINGCYLLKFVIEQCDSYQQFRRVLENNPRVASGKFSETLRKLTDETLAQRRSVSVFTKDPDDGKVKKVPYTHQAIAIVRDGGLLSREETNQKFDPVAPRLQEVHAIVNGAGQIGSVTIDAEIFGHTPTGEECDVVLNLDVKEFWTEVEHDDVPIKTGNLIARCTVPREMVHNPDQERNLKNFHTHLSSYLVKWKSQNIGKAGKSSALIISSESLRTLGVEISYRVTWERSLTAVVAEIQGRGRSGGGGSDLADQLRKTIFDFDYVIVCFYNDGAVIVPTDEKEKRAVFVASPSEIEGDHSERFLGTMRGTETLVTAAVAYHLGSIENRGGCVLQSLQKAVVHGLKASRHLQSHGYVTMHECALKTLLGSNLNNCDEDKKEKAYYYLSEKLNTNSNYLDIFWYFWNRTRSAQYGYIGLVLEWDHGRAAISGDTKFCTWPFGDLIEILVSGYPGYGSFPPVGLKLEEGRDVIEKETSRVSSAYGDAGWLEVGHFPKDAADPNGSGGGYPFWSFRAVAIDRLADAIAEAGLQDVREATNLSVMLLCEMIVRFGTKWMNRLGIETAKYFDGKVLKRLEQYTCGTVSVPKFYENAFGCISIKSFLEKLIPFTLSDDSKKEVTRRSKEEPADKRFVDILRRDTWYRAPACGSWLGFFPECIVRRLHTIDARDTQSFRDVRERLRTFQRSNDTRPLNLAVLGAPGSGKSFGVRNIVEGVFGKDAVHFLEYNLASFSGNKSSLTSAFLEIQNAALQGKLPVVFWDEFDTTADNTKLAWLASFLGPMQDGRFFIDQNSRYLPKCVFIFAGSIFSRFDQIRLLDAWQNCESLGKLRYHFASGYTADLVDQEGDGNTLVYSDGSDPKAKIHIHLPCSLEDWRRAKGKDFKSRITGILDVHSVDPPTPDEIRFGLKEDEHAWLFRRAAAIRNSFETHAPHMISRESGELIISSESLFCLLTVDRYSHGHRSIESLVKMSCLSRRAIVDGSVLPTDSQARIHADSNMSRSARATTYREFPVPP